MKKIITIITLACTTTFVLFALMAYIIHNDNILIHEAGSTVIVSVYQTPNDTGPEKIERPKLTPPPPPEPRPVEVEPVEIITTGIDISIPSIAIDLDNEGAVLSSLPSERDSEASPIVRISPKYPSKAIKDGLEGWVKLAFDINSLGEVINVKVLAAQPKRIFNKAATRALKKWKYKAKYIDGKQVEQKDLTVQLDFNLEQQS